MATSYKPVAVRQQKEQLMALLVEKARRISRRKFYDYYPDTGPLRRELYKKHMAFFAAGASFRERCAMAANRIGKTEGIGGYELTCHLTGNYPAWWTGCKFERPIRSWAAGTTAQTVRDILQRKLLGPVIDIGTGLIPGDLIVDLRRKAGSVPDTFETIFVRHASGGVSALTLKSYEQGRKAFEGDEQDVILLDEEPPLNIYTECLTRIMPRTVLRGKQDTKGRLMLTFTPLDGLTETVLQFMPGGQIPEVMDTRFIIQADWDDAPHLSEDDKREILASYPPHQRDARTKGIPQLGSGAIYPISEDDIFVADFEIPPFWPRAYGFDVGWNWTAAAWGALNRETDVLYLYNEYKRGQAEPEVHSNAIQMRGDWIPGTSDPAANQRSQRDGEALFTAYTDLGLKLINADNAVEAGIFEVWKRMVTGRLKVFRSLASWREEFRIYRRDDKGHVVKSNDHLMDCTRYLVMTGTSIAEIIPAYLIAEEKPGEFNPLHYGLRGGH